jgi:hypothetical protein
MGATIEVGLHLTGMAHSKRTTSLTAVNHIKGDTSPSILQVG